MSAIKFTSVDSTPLVGIFAGPDDAKVAVVLAHGITAEKDEDGFFSTLAARLADSGVLSLRFDFRGHGDSGGEPIGMTVAGETLDLAAAMQQLRARAMRAGRVGIVAASFGAVSTACLLSQQPDIADFVVFLNPVLDMQRTFIEPELPWAKESFTPEALARVDQAGRVLIDDNFPAGRELVREMADGPQPYALLAETQLPMLVVHGSADTYVSFDIAREFAMGRPHTKFVPIAGAEHGFGRRHEADEVYAAVAGWISSESRG